MPRHKFNLSQFRREHSGQSSTSFRSAKPEDWWRDKYDQKPTRKSKKPVPEDKQDRVYSGPLNKLVTYAINSIHGQGVSFREKPGQTKFDAGVQALMHSIKKIDRRIVKAKEQKDAPKVMKLESLKTRQLHLLQEANSVKQHLDQRSLNRKRNEDAIANGEMVRIGKRNEKLVPRKKRQANRPDIPVEPRNPVAKIIVSERVSKGVGHETDKTKKTNGGVSPWSDAEKMQLDDEFRRMFGDD